MANAISINNRIEGAITAAQYAQLHQDAGSDQVRPTAVTVPIKKVETTATAQQRVDQLRALSQVNAPQWNEQSQSFGFLQVDSELDADVAADHVIMPLQNNQNYGYIGEFFLGSINATAEEGEQGAIQPIRILLDTGSANSWILSRESVDVECDADDWGNDSQTCTGNFAYNPDLSRGGTQTIPDDDHKQHVHITFGSGDLRGYFVQDRCTIGDPDPTAPATDRLVLDDYTFGMVTEQTAFHNTFDAIIGLAYPQFAEPGVTPLFDSMMEANILGFDVFAFHMSMNPDNETSEVMFGDWNTEKIDQTYNNGTGDLDWHSVQHQLFWSIALDDVLIDGESLGLCDDKDCLFTPDTGTSLSTFPSWAMTQFNSENPEYSADNACDSEFTFGNLTYVINGIQYPIYSHHWMQKTITNTDDNSGTCAHTIGTLDVGQQGLNNLFIGGDVFMQIYYTVFDRNLDMVGFAKAQHTEPEVVTHYNAMSFYVDTLLVEEACYSDPSQCYV